jgi:hypothetical protein
MIMPIKADIFDLLESLLLIMFAPLELSSLPARSAVLN